MENNKNNNNQASSITLSDILRVIKKNWIIIAVITVFVFLCGAVYTYAIVKPKYKATATIKVEIPLSEEAKASDFSNASSAALRYVDSVSKAVKNSKILSAVAQRHTDIITYKQLKSEVSSSFSTSNFFVDITVTDKSGENARVLVDDIATEISKYSNTSTDENISEDDKFQCSISTFYVSNKDDAYSYASPNKKLYLIVSLLGGIVVSLVVVFIKEFTSNKFQTPDEVKTLGLPVLNTLIDDKSKENEDNKALLEPSVKNFEPYNRLISNVKFSNVDNPYRVIMFTSSVMNELKTTVCSNYAYTLAHNEKKVIIIDLDTRKPRVHKVFNLTKENGIVEYLSDQIKLDELIKHTDKNVDIITVGKEVSNPVTLLESQKLVELIAELKEIYDYILLDTPPLTACNDAAIVSKLAEAVVFNVAINQGKKKEIKASIDQLIDAKANLIGINITKANIKDRDSYNYYYYYEYGDKK